MNKDVIIAQVGAKKYPLMFTIGEHKGKRTFDIRRYYRDNSGENQPTRKGITVTIQTFQMICGVIDEHREKIITWLTRGEHGKNEVKADRDAQLNAAKEAFFKAKTYGVENKRVPSDVFFDIKSEGGHDSLVWNSKHLIFKCLAGDDNAEPSLDKVIEMIVLTYARAKNMVMDGPIADSQTMFEIFEANWGIGLNNYIEQSRRLNR